MAIICTVCVAAIESLFVRAGQLIGELVVSDCMQVVKSIASPREVLRFVLMRCLMLKTIVR